MARTPPENLSDTEKAIWQEAVDFARQNKDEIAKEITCVDRHPAEEHPVSIFMAGSPGAGKTEWSKRFIQNATSAGLLKEPIRIDADDLRDKLPGYTGNNSKIFQAAASILVSKIIDYAFKQHQPFLLDGTFSNQALSEQNIVRSLDKGRSVLVNYVYQDPLIAWKFTKVREQLEGRHIPKEAFIDQFLGAKETVGYIRHKFGDLIRVALIKKNLGMNNEEVVYLGPQDLSIDPYLGQGYSRHDLESLLP